MTQHNTTDASRTHRLWFIIYFYALGMRVLTFYSNSNELLKIKKKTCVAAWYTTKTHAKISTMRQNTKQTLLVVFLSWSVCLRYKIQSKKYNKTSCLCLTNTNQSYANISKR